MKKLEPTERANKHRSSHISSRLNKSKTLFRQTFLFIAISGSFLNGSSAFASEVLDGGTIVKVPESQSSPWNIIGELIVGDNGGGALLIQEGGTVTNSDYTDIGDLSGAVGVIEVAGAGASFDNGHNIDVGRSGNGLIFIHEGGVVTNSYDTNIGNLAGSKGIIEVSGAGSLFDNGHYLTVGNLGNGSLLIRNGGVVNSFTGIISNDLNSIGSAEVSGTDAQWNNSGLLYIGNFGNGTLTISDGGVVTNSMAVLGSHAGAVGIADISGAGSQWNNRSTIYVGDKGNGQLTIHDGGVVNSYGGGIGVNSGSTGSIEVSGVGSQWNSSDMLVVGNVGNGSLSITDRAEVSATSVMIAVNAASSSNLNIGNGALAGTLNTASISGGDGSATVNFNHTDNIDFSPQLTGSLTVNQINQGSTKLTSVNDYSGVTTIDSGSLQAGTTGAFSSRSDFITNTGGTLDLAGYDQTLASLNNAGTVSFNGTPGTILTISGDYTGNNGLLNFNTALNGDTSATDKMVVQGNTSGTTYVSVTNAGGSGAETLNGIELIQVNGTSDGQFVQKGRIVAGAYEYYLNKGSVATPNDGGWYLNSQILPPDPVDPIPDPTPDNIVRPEAGSYMANMAAASKLFNLRLEDREGRAENSSMWLRQQGDRTKFRDSSGQIKTSTNTYVIQGGGEVVSTQFTDTDRLGVGLMLGYGESDSESSNNRSGYGSKGKVDGYNGGIYATWYQDAKTLNGAYVDSWVQYSLLNGEVNGDQLSSESYDMKGMSASIESGYRIPIYQGENGHMYVTPQAQIIWNGIKADDHTEANGTRVTSDGNNNVQTRLGVKLSRDGANDQDKGMDKLFTTYVEANWLHNTEQAGATMDDVTIQQAGNTNVGELKVGAEGQLNKHVNLWTNVAQQMGDNGYSDTALTIGIKYKF